MAVLSDLNDDGDGDECAAERLPFQANGGFTPGHGIHPSFGGFGRAGR